MVPIGSFSKTISKLLLRFFPWIFSVCSSVMWHVQHNGIIIVIRMSTGYDILISSPGCAWVAHKKNIICIIPSFIFPGCFTLCCMWLWIFVLDYQKYFKSRVGESVRRMKYWSLIFWCSKLFHAFLFVDFDLPGGIWHAGWSGSSLSRTCLRIGYWFSVFPLAHTVEHTAFPVPHRNW